MNDTEINLMQKMLQMDPYQRITARQAIEHDWFDDLRAKDPEYVGDDQSSEDNRLEGNESTGQILGGNKRVLSPELLN
jgi:serine/threonine protein kinase